MSFLKKLLGGGSEAEVKRLMKTVGVINSLEPRYQIMSHRELIDATEALKRRAQDGESLDSMLPEAFALLREGTVRSLSKRQFDVQLIGGIVLHQGRISEMKTGEGKTYCAPLAAFLNALAGKGVHIVTVNDYLAKYHGEMIGKVFRYLGMSCGIILHDLDNSQRREAYACDITYGTNNEFGFDYLRDNMVVYKEEMVQRGHNYAIIDEVDSILIDEARTPLIISGMGDKSTELYTLADRFVTRLREGEDNDFTKDEKQKTINLTEKGVGKAEAAFSLDNLADPDNAEYSHHINQALRARFLMARDRDYVVQEGQVVIVDEFTGRLMTGRRYSDGLHQAIEAKENVKVERESKTLATITFQNYFRMYDKLAGMTGTAKTEEEEFKSIYGLDVVEIPTNKPMIREDLNDLIYKTEKGKYAAVVEEIIEKHGKSQPVLVGTVSVEKSELLSHMLDMRGVKHEVLNAKHHQKEAEIVAQAGKAGAVTIATNMAGRGTDILLGGNAEFLARREMRKREYADELIEEATGHAETDDAEILDARNEYGTLLDGFEKETGREHDSVAAGGGLHIIGTERHESRRIDNQLRGRAGRQGDMGSTRFYLSLEDDLLRLFGSDRIASIVDRLGMEEDQPIEYGLLSKQIENAQKRVEGRNFDSRRHVLQYDDVMNQQREIIYSQRRKVLYGENMRDYVMDMLTGFINTAVDRVTGDGKSSPDEWDVDGLLHRCESVFLPKGSQSYTPDEVDMLTPEALKKRLNELGQEEYARREAKMAEHGANMRDVERAVILRAVDSHWMDHIDAMDQLRSGIGLRALAQRNPIVEFKFEGFEMFDEMVHSIQEDTLRMLFHLTIEKDQAQRRRVAEPVRAGLAGDELPAKRRSAAPVKVDKKVGRNDLCPCGSGKKYKNCHGAPN